MISNVKTGFCVPYSVRDTPDKGLGVFAKVPINKGAILYRNIREQLKVYDELSLKEFLGQLSRSEVVYELTHMFGLPEFPGYIIKILDDGALINHSFQPTTEMSNRSGENEIPYNTSPQNTQDVEDAFLSDRFALVAIQDVKAGDELTMDYNIIGEEPSYYDDLYDEYGVSESYLDETE